MLGNQYSHGSARCSRGQTTRIGTYSHTSDDGRTEYYIDGDTVHGCENARIGQVYLKIGIGYDHDSEVIAGMEDPCDYQMHIYATSCSLVETILGQ
jgi:hypothetical protein